VRSGDIRSHPFVAALCFLVIFSAFFFALHSRLADGVFIIGNLLPLIFGALFGMRWGVRYALLHGIQVVFLGSMAGIGFDRFISNGIPAAIVTIILSGAIGRIRDLTTSLQQELKERRRYELELQEHRTHLQSLVEERTAELVKSNDQLKQETAERERAETETRDLGASLKRAEKMEALGVLAGSVAHDLNNILSGLIGYPELMLLDLPEDSPMREALVAIRESGLRAAAVVQDLLIMARRGITSTQVLDLNAVVSGVMRSPEFLSLKARHRGVRIATALNPAVLNIQGSAAHMARAILNLVLNAMEAIENGGQVTVSTTNVYIDTRSSSYEVLAEGEYVALTVADTGKGIPREDLDRIFEPFYTSKAMGRSGTGLGLAIVWGTVKDHNGFIDVHSEQGRGSVFTLLLPATREQAVAETLGARCGEYLGNGESILVVDDVRTQRDLCAAMLTRLGYSVAVATSGEEAVEHLKHSSVDLLILDMIMEPGIDGLETYRRIVAIRPGQKAVIASGFSESQRVKDAQALGAGAYIRKPYTVDRIAAVVKEALQGRTHRSCEQQASLRST
jgi:signal transduction histidine kinase/ActR/RegA family two-component response regulator